MLIGKNALVDEIISILPSGAPLDELALKCDLSPGDISNSLSEEVEKILTGRKGLGGVKLVASVTSNVSLINDILENGNRTVVHSLTYNKNLTKEHVNALVERCLQTKDGNLAIALFRARPEIGSILKNNPSLFDLVSLSHRDKPVFTALPANVSKMSYNQIKDLMDVSKANDFNTYYTNDFVDLILILFFHMVGRNQCLAPDLNVLELIGKQNRTGRFKIEKDKYLRAISQKLPPAEKGLLETFIAKKNNYNNTNSIVAGKHNCSPLAIEQLYEKMVSSERWVSRDWECWSLGFNAFNKADHKERFKVYTQADNQLKEELIYHFPDFVEHLLSNSDEYKMLNDFELDKITSYSNHHFKLILEMASKGKEYRTASFAKNSFQFYREHDCTIQEKYILLLALAEDKNVSGNLKIILNYVELDALIEIRNFCVAKDVATRNIVKEIDKIIINIAISDPYATEDSFELLLNKADVGHLSMFSKNALNYMAKKYVNNPNFTYSSLFALNSLVVDWSGSLDDLFNASFKL